MRLEVDVHSLQKFATNQKRLIELVKEMENTSNEFKELCHENERTIHKIFQIIKEEERKGKEGEDNG